MKLSVKILLIFSISTIIVVSVIGSISFTFTKNSLEKAIGESQLQLAVVEMDKIDRVLYKAYEDIQIISEAEDFEEFFISGNIKESVNTLDEFIFLTGPWDRLVLMNPDAVTILSTDDEIGRGSVFMEAHNITIQKGEVFVSDVLISPVTGKPTIIFGAPIFDESSDEEKVIGMVRGEFSWSVIIGILEEINKERVLLVNNKGVVIGEGSRGGLNISEELISDNVIVDVDSYREEGDHSGIHETGIDIDEEVLSSVVAQKGYLKYKGSDWTLVINSTTEETFATARSEGIQLTLIVAILIILIFIVIYFLIQVLLIKPVVGLSKVSIAIAGGDLKSRAEIRGKDEIGELANNFNKMADSLSESRQGLEKKVETRTKEFEQANKIMMGRESRIAELKEENQELRKKSSADNKATDNESQFYDSNI